MLRQSQVPAEFPSPVTARMGRLAVFSITRLLLRAGDFTFPDPTPLHLGKAKKLQR